jgi:hypothetical protein
LIRRRSVTWVSSKLKPRLFKQLNGVSIYQRRAVFPSHCRWYSLWQQSAVLRQVSAKPIGKRLRCSCYIRRLVFVSHRFSETKIIAEQAIFLSCTKTKFIF